MNYKTVLCFSLFTISANQIIAQTTDSISASIANGYGPVVTSNTIGTTASTLQLSSTVYPITSDQTVIWSLFSSSVVNATVDANTGMLTIPAQTSGKVTVQATSMADFSKFDTLQVNVYCKPPHTNPINWFVIDNLSIPPTTLNNSSTGLGNIGAYTLFPTTGSSSATLVPGNTYSINAVVTSTSATFPPDSTMHTFSMSAWIDYNRDNLLDASEWFSIEDSASSSNVSNSFTVPISATEGWTVLRVRSRLQGSANGSIDACTNYFGSGQTEDYVIYISSSPLSIDLVNFDAKKINDENEITWQIAGCDEGDFFELQKSSDGKNFRKITSVKAIAMVHHYQYNDDDVMDKKNYYRLKLNHANGEYDYSKTILVDAAVKAMERLSVFPNPATSAIHITGINNEVAAQFIITDIQGRVLKQLNEAQNMIDISDLQKGIYFFRYMQDGKYETIKFVKQ